MRKRVFVHYFVFPFQPYIFHGGSIFRFLGLLPLLLHPSGCPSARRRAHVKKARFAQLPLGIYLRDTTHHEEAMHLASGVTERAVKLEWRIIDLAKLVGQGLRRSKTWRSFTHFYFVRWLCPSPAREDLSVTDQFDGWNVCQRSQTRYFRRFLSECATPARDFMAARRVARYIRNEATARVIIPFGIVIRWCHTGSGRRRWVEAQTEGPRDTET